jgi:hypothetical protein
MSFISSASDNLIAPVNAASGQVLTWNATTGQFEPTTIPSGDTPELLLWAANTAYLSGDTVSANLISSVILRKAGAGTSSATLDATELAAWRYFGQNNYPAFLASSLVCTNFVISQGGQLWQSISNRVTGAAFDATEQTNWVALTTASTPPASNSITSAMIVNGTIQTLDIADQVVTGAKIAPGTITFDKIADGTIISSKLQDGGITAAKMGVGSVASSNIIDGTIQNGDIGAGQIGLDKLAPIPTTSLIGLGVAGSPTMPTNITLGTNLSFSGNVLNAAVPAPLPIFNNNQVLRGDGSNTPASDARITFDIAAGAVNISATGSGDLTLGSGSTGNITVGSDSTTRLTTLKGIVKRPNYARLTVASAGNQVLIANTISPVVFGGVNNIVGSGLSQPTTSTFAVTRTGLYRIDLNLSIQSATANTRGIVSITTGTATLTDQPVGMLTKAIRLRAANTAEEITWSLFLPVTVAGTFSVSVTMLVASQINNYNGATGTAATTNISILEIA